MIFDLIKHAKQMIFDNSTNGMSATNVQGAIDELNTDLKSVNASLKSVNASLKSVNASLGRYVITNPIVTSVAGQKYIDLVIKNTGAASAPIAMITDVLSDNYSVTGVKFINSNTCTWRFYFNREFATSVNFRMAIHYKTLS